MRTQKTFSERFMELPTDAEKWQFVKENVKAWCKELDAETQARQQRIKARQTLKDLNPFFAMGNPHMGIVVNNKPQQ